MRESLAEKRNKIEDCVARFDGDCGSRQCRHEALDAITLESLQQRLRLRAA